MKIKSTIIAIMCITCMPCCIMKAQSLQEDTGKNLVKFNALALIGGKFSFEYERALTPKIAVGAAVSFRPEKGIPFSSSVKKAFDVNDEINKVIDEFSSSNFSFTPEVRLYTSSKAPFRGFYFAPYVKFASYKADTPYDFDVDVQGYYSRAETIPLSGDITSFTAGFAIGANFKISKNIYLDWRIIGPGYGTSKGDIAGQMLLDPDEQDALRIGLDELKYELEDMVIPIKMDYDVDYEGAIIKIRKSPWASIRSGFSLAYRF